MAWIKIKSAIIASLVVASILTCGVVRYSAFAAVGADQAANLLQNPGLEKGAGGAPDGWVKGRDVSGVEYIWDNTYAHTGQSSICLKKSEQRYFPIAQWSQAFHCATNARSFKVSAWVKADNVTKAVLDVQFLDDDGNVLGHKWAAYIGPQNPGEPLATHDWKMYSGTVDVPDGTKQIAVAPQIYGPGTVWFDDLKGEYPGLKRSDW